MAVTNQRLVGVDYRPATAAVGFVLASCQCDFLLALATDQPGGRPGRGSLSERQEPQKPGDPRDRPYPGCHYSGCSPMARKGLHRLAETIELATLT